MGREFLCYISHRGLFYVTISRLSIIMSVDQAILEYSTLDNRMLPYLIIKTMDFPHCSDCLQLENIALGHLTAIYSRLNGVNNCCEMPQSIIS
jgi:hypothetical protein